MNSQKVPFPLVDLAALFVNIGPDKIWVIDEIPNSLQKTFAEVRYAEESNLRASSVYGGKTSLT